ncbi:MAG: sigma-54-dependent transcriptional regulator [Gammaproteobacteria bacterium]
MDQARDGTVMIVDDTPTNLGVLSECLNGAGFRVLVAQDGASAVEQAERARPDIILLDIRMPGLDGYETCQRLKESTKTEQIPVIFMTALSETQDKVRAFAVGGVDYVTKPFQHEEVLARVRTHLGIQRLQRQLSERNARLQEALEAYRHAQATVGYLHEEIKADHNFETIIGECRALKELFHKVELVAPTDTTVLIQGETGTGKELVARALHHRSTRRERPLVKVNCAALPRELIESELFGHERGAFTGATQSRKGRFELAHKGSIFLDEVGELPLEAQAKLLRVLQEQEFERVGGTRTTQVDVRVIAATNRDLAVEVEQGTFRTDLFYRLAVFPLLVPALRERREDIPLVVRFFLGRLSRKLGKPLSGVSQASLDQLMRYHWPGNIRELQNVLEHAAILTQAPVLEIEQPLQTRSLVNPPSLSGTLEEVERSYMLQVLKETDWVIEGDRGAAAVLGLHPSTLRNRMRKLGIRKPPLML